MGLRMLCAAATGAAAGLLLFVPAASGRTEYASDVCIDAQPAYTFFIYSDPGTGCGATTTTTYDWDVSPSYSGTYFTDSASADAAEPAPPPPVTPVVPTWRNLYDWPNGHGYAGWHSASSGQAGAYGMQTALGGQYGLWLWPTGGGSYSYTGGNYAEWTYAAPGTTRLSNATLQFTYRNKLLAHHCIDIGFRTAAGTVVTHNEHCKPVSPPDSQRQVTVSLVDPSANPTSKLLYFRIRVDCGGATSCSKNIPQLDPLATGGYARMLEADMTLVDDDAPAIAATGPFRDLDGTYVNGQGAYDLTLTGQDAGSGILQVWADQLGAGRLVTASAPCDPTHMTPALDNRICPPSYAFTTAIDTRPFPEGTNRFTAGASDLAANVGATPSWSVIVDRSAPTGVSGIALADFDGTQGTGEIDWQPGADPALRDGTPGSGVATYQFRLDKNGGGFTDWGQTSKPGLFFDEAATGDIFTVEVRAIDVVGNVSGVASGTVTITPLDGGDPIDSAPAEDTPEEALMRDYGVSADEAAGRIDRQPAIEDLDDYLTTNQPTTFAGLWVDNAHGGAIMVATTRPGITAGLATQFGLPADLVREVPVTKSLADLEAIADYIFQRSASVAVEANQPGYAIMPATNSVVLRVANPFDSQVQQIMSDLRATYGTTLVQSVVDADVASEQACTRFQCPPPLRGGIEIWHPLNKEGLVDLCTAGFYAHDADSNPVILTAGHCGGGVWYHGRKAHKIGSVIKRQFSGKIDSELVKINDPKFWTPQNWIFHRKTATDFPITSVAKKISIGTYLCHSGRTTGTHCGKVTAVNVSWKNKLRGLVEVQACSGPGDSGGPVYNVKHHRAYGVLSLGTPCTHTKRDIFDFLPIGNTIKAWNLTIATS